MIAQADAVRIPLPDQSVHCVMTSPPYWGLRKYAGDQGEEPLGLESTPERHVERMVDVFREVRRVLRDDGVVWLNYGDCYGTGTTAARRPGNRGIGQNTQNAQDIDRHGGQAGQLMMMPHRVALALQADGWIVRQDLVWYKRNPMPESVNGWRWQQEREKKGRSNHAKKHNIKGGTEAMLRDASIHQGIGPDWVPEYEYGDELELKRGSWRHTRAHEYVFQLVKGPKMKYWSNQEAVRETGTSGPSDIRKMEQGLDRIGGKNKELIDPLARASATTKLGQKRAVGDPSGRNPRSVLDIPTDSMELFYYWLAERTGFDLYELIEQFQDEATNPNDVLDIPTAPYKGAHYATFPPNLIAPLIRATCPRWACPVCGQGWAAVVEAPFVGDNIGVRPDNPHASGHLARPPAGARFKGQVLGYRPTCEHPHTQEEAVPGIVFDPFVGSGTTVKVAQDLLRRGIGIDLSMEYLDLQAKIRTGQGSPSNQLDNLPLFE